MLLPARRVLDFAGAGMRKACSTVNIPVVGDPGRRAVLVLELGIGGHRVCNRGGRIGAGEGVVEEVHRYGRRRS